ncbi:hypothetical protein PBI_WHIRLWIND_77 [Mycobacterium phage Whirlwind]|uniref:Uncharacterized protein n=1 Tax=Mycobacterium phage Whirlwind TaxID=1340826 RepID=S5YML0_9CAUD|nr:hypothetical protein N852_gp102 [Mycobacterium phage Whirlwind]AGT12683.1 hypothetical protein PBI_WHIRLWIND_77 [Mycobacterium phage Whirlwind]
MFVGIVYVLLLVALTVAGAKAIKALDTNYLEEDENADD